MRRVSALCGAFVLATTVWGCVSPVDQTSVRRNVGVESPAKPPPTPPAPAQALMVSGTIQGSEKGSSDLGLAGTDIIERAVKLIVSVLDPTGQLIPVGVGNLLPGGKFEIRVYSNDPGGLFILSVLDAADAVVGSAVLNGIPAFAKGFLVDIPIDTLTSYKTQILMTLASGGEPGVQNYLNVINTFLDDELAGVLIVVSAFVSDHVAIVGTVAKAIVAAENAMVSLLAAAGLPVDFSKVTDAQLAALTGYQGDVVNANGKLFTTTKNLLLALQEASAKDAEPIDSALFNAFVGAEAMFNSTLKGSLPAEAFTFTRSSFKLTAMASIETIDAMLDTASVDAKVAEALKNAGATFLARIEQATNLQGLIDAKAAYSDMLLGKQPTPSGNILSLLTALVSQLQAVLNGVTGRLDPMARELATNLSAPTLTTADIAGALFKFDASTKDVAATLAQTLSAKDAEALAEALKANAKVLLPL